MWSIDFGVLAWNCLFTPFFGDFLGHIFSIWRHSLLWLPKGTSLGGNTSFEPFSVRISAMVRPGHMRKKKHRTTKVTKVLYFLYLGRSPHWTHSTQKLHDRWCPRHNHVCHVSSWNLHGLWFYSWSNFRFFYYFNQKFGIVHVQHHGIKYNYITAIPDPNLPIQ